LTHLATSDVTAVPPPQDPEDRPLVFTQGPWETANVRGIVIAGLLITGLGPTARAQPDGSANTPHDPDGATRASGDRSPWIDLAPSKALEARQVVAKKPDHKLAASITLGGLYAGFAAWTYFAWYRKGCRPQPYECHQFVYGTKDRFFEVDTYAGGADKMGHLWATLAFARGGTELLHRWGGYDKRTATFIGTALSEALFLGVEFRDGFTYELSYGDAIFDTLGAGLALAQSLSPAVDDLVDFRVQYYPSEAYRRRFVPKGDVNVAEDYSGETYLLAFHLGAIPPLRTWTAGWARFVDIAVGFETRGYKPDPPCKVNPETCPDYDQRQSVFVGLTLNAQGVFDALLPRRSKARKAAHAVFEMLNLPFTTLPVLKKTRTPAGPVDQGGA
jgi:hypothetical protein